MHISLHAKCIYIYIYIYICITTYIYKWHACPGSYKKLYEKGGKRKVKEAEWRGGRKEADDGGGGCKDEG